jgi:hypothetical protein
MFVYKNSVSQEFQPPDIEFHESASVAIFLFLKSSDTEILETLGFC